MIHVSFYSSLVAMKAPILWIVIFLIIGLFEIARLQV